MFLTPGSGTETTGAADLKFLDTTMTVSEAGGTTTLCVQLDLSSPITTLGCPIAVDLTFSDGIFAGRIYSISIIIGEQSEPT